MLQQDGSVVWLRGIAYLSVHKQLTRLDHLEVTVNVVEVEKPEASKLDNRFS